MAKRKKIALLFATGTVLASLKNRSIVFVDSESDIPKWMESIPEISLIADIEPHFFLSESATVGYDETLRLSELIDSLRRQVDGIVILMRTESIIAQATLLNFLNQNVNIPVIITGAVVSPQALAEGVLSDLSKKNATLSLKSNVINATQVATRDFQGFGIMYGNRLIEPVRAQRDNIESLNVFSSVDNNYAGRVEFGISLNQKKKVTAPAKHFSRFSTAVSIIDSSFLTAELIDQCSGEVVIVKMRENEQLSVPMVDKLKGLKQPVILYNFWYVMEHKGLIALSHITESSLIAKAMWLASEAKTARQFSDTIVENTIGEILL